MRSTTSLDHWSRAQEAFERTSLATTSLEECSLYDFVQQAWHVVEPSTKFVEGWHLEAICEHLEAVSRGEIRSLIINVPPRHAKSLSVSVFWPVWEWISQPHLRYIYSAYGQDLSTRDALRSRRLIQSPWFQKRWGDAFSLTGDQNQKTRYENNKTGYRIATGVGGMATGEGGDRLVLDDPHKLVDAHSDIALASATTFWFETMSTRLNDPETGAKVVIMQRIHERDVTGEIIRRMRSGGERYEMLVLPAEYEPGKPRYPSSIGWEDPRTEDGELLWPERFSKSSLNGLKASLGPQASGQLQQRPVPAGGAIFKRQWFRYYYSNVEGYENHYYLDAPVPQRVPEAFCWRFITVDLAVSTKQSSDYTVAQVWIVTHQGDMLLEHMVRERMEGPDHLPLLWSLYKRFNPSYIGVEKVAYQVSLIQAALREGLPIRELHPDKDKVTRAIPAAIRMEAGKVYFKAGATWLGDLEEELLSFPTGAHDDAADCTAYACREIALGQATRRDYDTTSSTNDGPFGAVDEMFSDFRR